jgi:hypothetical protein
MNLPSPKIPSAPFAAINRFLSPIGGEDKGEGQPAEQSRTLILSMSSPSNRRVFRAF